MPLQLLSSFLLYLLRLLPYLPIMLEKVLLKRIVTRSPVKKFKYSIVKIMWIFTEYIQNTLEYVLFNRVTVKQFVITVVIVTVIVAMYCKQNDMTETEQKKIYLWSVPRSMSTAFLRAMVTVDKCKVCEYHAPVFSFCYRSCQDSIFFIILIYHENTSSISC